MKKPVLLIILILQTGFLFAQLGGKRSYEFLNLPIGSRVAGLGGVVISATQDDVNLFLTNPSLLDSANDNHVSWSHLGFYADIKYNTFAYAKNFARIGMIGIGIQHMGYGDFEEFDASGNATGGRFNSNETAVTLSKSHQIGYFRMGANVRFVHGIIGNYSSSALAFDFGGSFIHPNQELVASILMKNFGAVLSDYSASGNSNLPSDVQIGVTFKPQDMPFRFTFTAYNLNKSNGTYYDESLSLESDKPKFRDQLFRHLNVGVEIVMGSNFNIRTGYNHLLRKELRLEERAGFGGLSLGFMAKVKAFEISYTFASYHVAGGRSYLTLTSNLNRVFKKKSIL